MFIYIYYLCGILIEMKYYFPEISAYSYNYKKILIYCKYMYVIIIAHDTCMSEWLSRKVRRETLIKLGDKESNSYRNCER